MTAVDTVFDSQINSLSLLGRGKVRDNYVIDEHTMLMVTSDRLSAFDVILSDPIPDKGRVLNQLSTFWLNTLAAKLKLPTHLTGIAPESVVTAQERDQVIGRAVVVKRLKPIMIEAVVRGYLIGSGWKDYQQSGAVCGINLPKGLVLAQQLPEPIFTPAFKANIGEHDENISFAQMQNQIGNDLAEQIRSISIALYQSAVSHTDTCGIIIADTKFEFGLDDKGVVHLMDEVLTPDSSRFWARAQYSAGQSPASFDKQFVRDYLESLMWDKQIPAPRLPQNIITQTADKYREALLRLTGSSLQAN